MSAEGAPFSGAYQGKRVLLTGHTGFKGVWLAWWLRRLGAQVWGLALDPNTEPNLFELTGLDAAEGMHNKILDVRAAEEVASWVEDARPDVVFHLAAQAVVRESYRDPHETIDVNVSGTSSVLAAVRRAGAPCAVVVVTSDKCYENREWDHGYREEDRLGGRDPYSASKACAELVVESYRRSFFPPQSVETHGVALASARAGNVIGPGDWAAYRLIPDAMRAFLSGQAVEIRSPDAVRPWQHVLESLAGYLLLGSQLLGPERGRFCEAWNFGPALESQVPVREVLNILVESWEGASWNVVGDSAKLAEAGLLHLSADKARRRLGWSPILSLWETVRRTASGYRALEQAATSAERRGVLEAEIDAYLAAASQAKQTWAG